MEKVINDYEIKEIALNPAYMTNDDLESLINQGLFAVIMDNKLLWWRRC